MSGGSPGHRYRVLPGAYAVARLAPDAAEPDWARAPGAFSSVTRTPDELSIIGPAAAVPSEVRASRDWRVLQLVGPFPFDAIGVLASFAVPLREARVSLLAVATYKTDYVLVKAADLPAATAALARAGHILESG